MSEGNKSRTVAATQMNAESSRSHAVFSIVLRQTMFDLASQVPRNILCVCCGESERVALQYSILLADHS